MDQKTLLKLKKKELELAKAKLAFEKDLPHLHAMKFYKWSRQFYESENRVNLVCAANQISKSSTLIRRAIADSTDEERWHRFWNKKPGMLWYFYPDSSTLEKEWETKWIKEWMPRGAMEHDPQFGWKLNKKSGKPHAIHFNSGVHIFFQTYMQKVTSIQAGTVHEIFCDEELPMTFYDEIMFRLTTTNGIFNAGFTPTLNQVFWKRAIETNKVLPTALKLQVSMYDCLKYEDGSPSTAFTIEKIEEQKSKCKNETEIQRRIYGRFVSEQGRTYYAFEMDKHFVPRKPISNLIIFGGVDVGSGGESGHPAAIVFIGVEPDYKKGYVIRAWRGDNLSTTAGDVFNKYREMIRDLPNVVQHIYDPGSKDFGVIAERSGITFTKADKSRSLGEENVNTLFKYGMLELFDDDDEIQKLGVELSHVMRENQSGTHKKDDDLADTLRYVAYLIPWDFSAIEDMIKKQEEEKKVVVKALTESELIALQIEERRGIHGKRTDEGSGWEELDEEFDYWNEQYG